MSTTQLPFLSPPFRSTALFFFSAAISRLTVEIETSSFSFISSVIFSIIFSITVEPWRERLGFLPGDLQQKVDPYLRPLYDALFDMLGAETFARLHEKGTIEVAPLAYMRGRTLDDSFIILDEAQNTTKEQMKMFLTRLGFNSKMIVTGDLTQVDLPDGKQSGLTDAVRVLKSVEDIKIVRFSEKDVVRHKLVQSIVKAYEKAEESKRKNDYKRRQSNI